MFVSVTDPEENKFTGRNCAHQCHSGGIEVNQFYLVLLGAIFISMLIVIFVYHRGLRSVLQRLKSFNRCDNEDTFDRRRNRRAYTPLLAMIQA